MVLQLTDFTSEITDEELREFTSEYYIPSALHPVVPAADASIADFPVGKVGVYTRFFEFANQRVPLSLFMCNILNHYRLHISQLHCIGAAKISNFEVNCRLLAINPTVHLFRAFYHTCWSNGWVSFSKRAGRLQCYTEKLDALRRWREMFFWVDDMLVPWDFAFYTQGLLPRDERPPPGSYSVEDAELINDNRIPINAYSEAFLCHMGISRNYFQSLEEVPTFIGDDGWGGCLSFLLLRSVVVVHLNKPKLVTEGVRPLRDGEEGEEPLLESTAGRTMELVLEQPEIESTDVLAPTPLRSVPSITVDPPCQTQQALALQKMLMSQKWILGLKRKRGYRIMARAPSRECPSQSRVDSRPTSDSVERRRSLIRYCQQSALVGAAESEVEQERADAAEYKASCHWAVKYLEGGKNNHFAGLDDFRHKVEGLLEKQEDKWLISHGLRLAAMSTLESQEVRQSFGDVVKCALARGKAEAVEELHERRLLTVPAAQVPGYNQKAYEELVAAMEAMKLLELPHIAQPTEGPLKAQPDYVSKRRSQLQVPIFASPRDILNPFALEKEVPLKESLEDPCPIRLAKKKGVKGKAILCGVWCCSPPHSDGVTI
ncbi:hypothetical protein Tco_1508564 [Tanacetum coccineum]